MRVNHYKYLEKHLPAFFAKIGINWDCNSGIISAHGDKCYQYRTDWEEQGIPFSHGVAIYLASYCKPYNKEVRMTDEGFIRPDDWTIEKYSLWKDLLPLVDETDKDILSII